MKHLILILLLIYLVPSCRETDKNKDRIARLVHKWQGKEVLFPENLIFTYLLTDTVDYKIPQSEHKVVIYVDSIGCTSCKLQLHKWKELIKHTDSITRENIPFLFFFQSKDKKMLRYLLMESDFELPICLDLDDQFNNLNKFPTDMTFQTFLLDKNNKVVVLGNPIHNTAIRDLYIKQMTGRDNPTSKLIKTTAEVKQSEIDFGAFNQSETKKTIFEIKNTGNNSLVILDVSTTCGCTVATYDKQPAKPGEILRVEIKMTLKDTGFFDETITVKCNTDEVVKLKIKGNIRQSKEGELALSPQKQLKQFPQNPRKEVYDGYIMQLRILC